MAEKSTGETAAALLLIGEVVVQAVRESGLLKPKRRIVRKRKAKKAAAPKPAEKRDRTKPSKPKPTEPRRRREEEEDEGDE